MYLFESVELDDVSDRAEMERVLGFIFKNGPLARRIAKPLQKSLTKPRLKEVYRVLTECLAQETLFEGI